MNLSEELQELKALVLRLLQKLEALQVENAALQEENTKLKAENAELRRRLGMDSTNSHKPPSSEGLTKKPAIARETGKKSGGQEGHQGNTLKMVDNPDEVIVHHAAQCPCCQKAFSTLDVVFIAQKRQVFDLPQPRLMVTEHQVGVVKCCGHYYLGCFPEAVNAPVQYGLRLSALSSLLSTDYRMPLEKISQLFYDLYGCSYNESTALSANQRLYEALVPVEEDIKAHILQSQVAHFDETGMRVEGKLHWFHTACTALFCYLFVHEKRGGKALTDEQSLLKEFSNWAVHDCWASYFDFTGCRHALCNAHIIRELNNLIEQGSQWAALMHALLFDLYRASEKGSKLVANKPAWVGHYEQICQKAAIEEPEPVQRSRGKPKNSKGRNLLNRLLIHKEAILAFAFEQVVPFTNNRAEQDIRCIKVKQKVAMSFRTFKGAQVYARIQGFVSTCRKQKMNVFQQICAVLNKQKVPFSTT